MKNKNVKVIDEHNIDRNANVMFALELEGSEYAVYWIERDTESNNVFVSKVLKNLDGTYNMLNIDDSDKKEEISNIVKLLVSTAVSDQNDKLVGTETTLSNGKVVKFVNVSFNKEQHINVQKTYITTVKKEVTKVAETYYDVVVDSVLESASVVAPVVEPIPTVVEPITVAQPEVVVQTPVVEPVLPSIPESVPVVEVAPVQVTSAPVVTPEPVVVTPAAVIPTPVVSEPVVAAQHVAPVVAEPVVTPTVVPTVEATPVVTQPVVETPVQVVPTPEVVAVTPAAVIPTPVVPEPIVEPVNQPLVFDATKEKNLNAALGEVANTANIPVENIGPVREFGVDAPVAQPVSQPQPTIAPMAQPTVAADPKVLSKKAGFANSKFFMFIAIAFFLASCIFLGYEVFNYFQLIK